MLDEICAYLRNWFMRSILPESVFTIRDGQLVLPPNRTILDGQYFRIVGSVFNDGVWKYPHTFEKDETFTGAVWLMGVPPQLVLLAKEIEDWCGANAQALNGPYQSESFGGYSYTKKTGASGDGGVYGWQDEFADRLARWRKI